MVEAPRAAFAGPPAVARVASHVRTPLTSGWTLLGTPPGTARTPADLALDEGHWHPALVPGTVAAADRAAGRLEALEHAPDYDASDWWYRTRIDVPPVEAGEAAWLGFEGLASAAEVWLNGELVAVSDDMFRALRVDVTDRLRSRNELVLRFPALGPRLGERRERARWRTALVSHQALRWFRTTLLGRMPGWAPPVAPVGPWRPVWLERQRILALDEGDIMPVLAEAGPTLLARLVVRLLDGARLRNATVECAGVRHALEVHALEADRALVHGTVPVPEAAPWWPHTHGVPALHPLVLRLETTAGTVDVDAGPVGFRALRADRTDGGFRLVVNGVPVFCRGASWTPPDVVSLQASDGELRETLVRMRDAGMNMVRVSGVMTYEDRRFHALCDELGILVWQDFMFARMDYPVDEAWMAEAVREVAEVVAARRRHPSLAVWCGNTEVAQQAAMLGIARDEWRHPLFDDVMPRLLCASGSDAPYVPGSPSGGALPFAVSEGVSHYFGVGAFRRALDDARRARVRFAAEALAFANVPASGGMGGIPELPHHPAWKARVPRDPGAGWDFDDVRDHYLERLHGVDAAALRAADPAEYLARSRLVTGEVMAQVVAEWRREGSSCWGALVWLLRDVWPGAGWGVLDHRGRPKPAWHLLARACAPRAVFLTDEGLDGLAIHVVNDAAAPLDARVVLRVLRDGRVPLAVGERALRVAPHARVALPAQALLERFHDLSYAYRFGPVEHDAVHVALREAGTGTLLASDLYLPMGPPRATPSLRLAGRFVATSGDTLTIELESERLAYGVRLDAGAWEPLDDCVHVVPGCPVPVRLRGPEGTRPDVLHAEPLNATARLRVVLLQD